MRKVCFDFNKAFDTIFHNVLTDKLIKYDLDKGTVKWMESWWNG